MYEYKYNDRDRVCEYREKRVCIKRESVCVCVCVERERKIERLCVNCK